MRFRLRTRSTPRCALRTAWSGWGRWRGCAERYYALTVERKLRHPAVAAITEAARAELFA